MSDEYTKNPKSEAEEMLEELAIKEAAEFLSKETDVTNELEREAAFAGYCCGFIRGFTMAIQAIKGNGKQ
jgi:hypothetical protein